MARSLNNALTIRELTEEIVARDDSEYLGYSDVQFVLQTLADIASEEISAGRPFTLPGVCKLVLRFREAKQRRFGTNSFTGEDQWFKAQPAKVALKAQPSPTLKQYAPTPRSAAGQSIAKATRRTSRSRS